MIVCYIVVFIIKNTNCFEKKISAEILINFESTCLLHILEWKSEWAKMEIVPISLWDLNLYVAMHI